MKAHQFPNSNGDMCWLVQFPLFYVINTIACMQSVSAQRRQGSQSNPLENNDDTIEREEVKKHLTCEIP
jgi:hypothetical protein